MAVGGLALVCSLCMSDRVDCTVCAVLTADMVGGLSR